MTDSPSSTGRTSRWADSVRYLARCRWTHAGILALVLTAALLSRTLRCNEGLPYLHRWGEPNIGSRSLDILRTGDLNPHWFRYGSPTIYMHAAVDAVCFLWLCSQPEDARDSIRSLDEIRTMADTKWQWTLSHPAFFHWNRLATAVLGAGTVLLTFFLARRLLGPWASTLAAAVVAGAAAHIEVSTTIRTDMPAALLALGAVLAALRAHETGRAGTLALSFFLAGLAASTKYNIVISLVAPLAVLVSATARREDLAKPWLWAAAFLLPPLAFVVGSPFALFDLPTFLSDAGAEVSHYKLEGQGRSTVEPGLAHMLSQLGQFRENVSWVGILLCIPGVLALGLRRAGWLLFAFPAVYFVFMTRTTVDFHHNFVALYPFIGIAAACGAEWIHRRLATRTADAAPFLAVVLVTLAALHLLPPVLEAWRIHRRPETRTQAIELVNELAHKHGWKTIGVARELRVHEIDLAQLEVEHQVKPLAALLDPEQPVDAIVCATGYTARKAEGEKAWKRVEHMNRITPKEGLTGAIEGAPIFLDIRSVDPGVSVFARD